jgi:hypothetical protein
MSEITVERFPDAERWLACAYSHDQSNAQVRELLAERTYLHARQLARLGQRQEALTVVGQCLNWTPDHLPAGSCNGPSPAGDPFRRGASEA